MSKINEYVHEFNGVFYVCIWDAQKNQMKGLAPKSVGGWYVSSGYSEKSAQYVGRAYKSRKSAVSASRCIYGNY